MLQFLLNVPIILGPAMAFMLIALAAGYVTVIKGDKEKGFLRALGLVLGFFIIVMSFFMLLLFSNIMRIERELSMMRRPMMPMMMSQQQPPPSVTIKPVAPKRGR